MNEITRRKDLEWILNNLADELDVPPSKYEDAKDHYDAVGSWLKDDESEIAPFNPEIFPQGSFALGTAIRPIGDEDYDVDAVCVLHLRKNLITQQLLKDMVGDRIKKNKLYASMLDPKEGGRRCWTLKYSDDSKFHLDILPAVPDEYGRLLSIGIPLEYAKYAVCITDKETWNKDIEWPKSNPKGYTNWFKDRMKEVLAENRGIIALEKRIDIEKVPDYEVRTPLQRVIQLLKRHRDVRYNGDEDKPISIIITTLAALAYNNERDLFDALSNIVPKMRLLIENRNGIWWVPNPVNPNENFADKWEESPRKAMIFFEWLSALEKEHAYLLSEQGYGKLDEYLSKTYGQRDADAALIRYSNKKKTTTSSSATSGGALANILNRVVSCFNVPHRENPKWPINLHPDYEVSITAQASKKGYRTFKFRSNSRPLDKHFSLHFEASTNVPQPYEVYWQVVNTGQEAAILGERGLRGKFFKGSLMQKESTLYKGMHWIECFIVKNGRCVARSREFVVNVE